MSDKKFSFEQAMVRLEQIAKQLESGETPIEQSLKLFEEGAALLKQCNTVLEQAEQKVAILTGKTADGAPLVKDFDAE